MKLKAFKKWKLSHSQVWSEFQAFYLGDEIDQAKLIQQFTPKGFRISEKFIHEYETQLLEYCNNQRMLSAYVHQVYIEGIYLERIRFDFLKSAILEKKFNGIRKEAMSARNYTNLLSIISGLGHSAVHFRTFLNLKCKYTISELDSDGFNITGDYYKPFQLIPIKPEEVSKEPFEKYLTEKGKNVFPKIIDHYKGSEQSPKMIASLVWFMKDDEILNRNTDFLHNSYKKEFNTALMGSLQLKNEIRNDSIKTPIKNFRIAKKSAFGNDQDNYRDNIEGIRDALKDITI